MEYRIRETSEVVGYAALLEAFPNTYIPANPDDAYLDALGVDKVQETFPPAVTEAQTAERDGISEADGKWVMAWKVVDRPAEETALRLAEAKIAKNEEINQGRESANFTSFPYQGQNIASDTLSRSDIDAVAGYISLFGTLPPNFPMAWKSIENTYIPLPDVDAFKAMYAAMAQQGTINFQNSQAAKTQLEAATTLAQVNAVPTGALPVNPPGTP